LFEPEETDNNYYILLDEYGYAVSVFCRPGLINDNGVLAYLKLLFSPSNKYNVIISSLSSSRENNIERKKAQESILKNNESLLESKNDKFNTILKEKEELNSKLERILSVALREGYWTPESYEDV
jgi:sulfopyruvate decarboxylase TPP-binding subunit